MNRLQLLSFSLLIGIQSIYATQGNGAEPARSPAAPSSQDDLTRVAVVIGNSRYSSGALVNPKNDATAMAAALKNLRFDVELKLDASKADLDATFKRFSSKTEKASVAVIFYAGHGIQVNGSNYIVPIGANPQSERDLKREMVKMDDLIDDMGNAKVKLVFFDACRDNPLSRSFSRGGSRGMAAPVEATGTLISFATKHGNTALDGEGKHSPYTTALLKELENPGGVEIEQMLRKVQQDVKQRTTGQQEPWRYGSLDGDFYFKAPAAPADITKAQKETIDRAVSDAMRQSSERATRDKAELQQSIKAQQVATESTVVEAIKRSSEQASRERAELQQSMEKMIKEALARQNAAIEAERAARQAASGEPVKTQTVTQQPSPAPSVAKVQPPAQLASIASTNTGSTSGLSQKSLPPLSSHPGDEWEYRSTDEKFGKKHKLVFRTMAASAEGVLEEIILDGKTVGEWVFGENAATIGAPVESEFMFAPHWNGGEFSEMPVEGVGSWCTSNATARTCKLSLKFAGNEKLTTAAGTFDAVRLEGWITFTEGRSVSGPVTIWYSKEHRRPLKQIAEVHGTRITFKETIELSAIRAVAR
jgi:uncharacterized caspase-like protein